MKKEKVQEPTQEEKDLQIPAWKLEELKRKEAYEKAITERMILVKNDIEDDDFVKVKLVANLD